jgi:hypothetical protein
MQHERHDLDGDDLAEIWRNAQYRPSEDLYSWLLNIFKKRRPLKSSEPRALHTGMLFLAPSGSPKAHVAKGGQSGQ